MTALGTVMELPHDLPKAAKRSLKTINSLTSASPIIISKFMHELIKLAKATINENKPLPFSAYASIKEQRILNVPVIKPLLIFVLSGIKKLGKDGEVACPAGSFVFLSNSPTIDMRNIPDDQEYFAVLIEFEYSDFNQFKHKRNNAKKYFRGEIDFVLAKTLQQYLEWSSFAPSRAWHFRKKELLQIIYQSGYVDVGNIAEPPSLSHQLHDIISENISHYWGVDHLSAKLAISESTLRRKLIAEGTNIKAIRDRTKLGHGLHLVQTTMEPIGCIAERCGYHSQSKFTNKFKHLFGITPTELRKTRVHE